MVLNENGISSLWTDWVTKGNVLSKAILGECVGVNKKPLRGKSVCVEVLSLQAP